MDGVGVGGAVGEETEAVAVFVREGVEIVVGVDMGLGVVEGKGGEDLGNDEVGNTVFVEEKGIVVEEDLLDAVVVLDAANNTARDIRGKAFFLGIGQGALVGGKESVVQQVVKGAKDVHIGI